MDSRKKPTQNSFSRRLVREAFSPEIRNLFYIVTGFVVVGTVFYHYVEDWAWIDSFYFSVMTLTTVGYGDFVPDTTIGKVFTTLFVFGGLGMVFTFLQTLGREQARSPFYRRLVGRDKDAQE